MTVERQGGSGVLSSIFGDKAQALRELPDNGLSEDQTTKIIQSSIEEQLVYKSSKNSTNWRTLKTGTASALWFG